MASPLEWIKEHIFKQTTKDGEIADVPFDQDDFNAMINRGAAIQKMAISQCEFKT